MGLKKVVSSALYPDTITVLGGVHGDETTGIEVVTLLTQLRDGSTIDESRFSPKQVALAKDILRLIESTDRTLNLELVNKKAMENGFRYMHKDINRCGTRGHLFTNTEPDPNSAYNKDSTIYEEHLTFELESKYPFGEAGVVIDLHSTTSHTLTSIVTDGGAEESNMKLARVIEKTINDTGEHGTLRVLKVGSLVGYNRVLMSSLSPHCLAIEWGPIVHGERSDKAITGTLTALHAAVNTVCTTTLTEGQEPFDYYYMDPAIPPAKIPEGYTVNPALIGKDFSLLDPSTSAVIHQKTGALGPLIGSLERFDDSIVGAFIKENSYTSAVHRDPTSPEPLPNFALFGVSKHKFVPSSNQATVAANVFTSHVA